ncbi:hypothetical protein TNCV_4913011 [Trichonephila clavipes]|nr:hypothetical protein TNCV_4913011 [Trichonephila clavipes]
MKVMGFSSNFLKNSDSPKLAKSSHQNGHQFTKMVSKAPDWSPSGYSVTKNDAYLALAPRFRQVTIESPL